MPAMQTPVTKRSDRACQLVGSTYSNAKFASAAMKVEREIRRRASNRSASPNRALKRAPATNPICTKLVNKEACKSSSLNSARNEGMTAVPENHRASARTTATTRIETDLNLLFRMCDLDPAHMKSHPSTNTRKSFELYGMHKQEDSSRFFMLAITLNFMIFLLNIKIFNCV